MVRLKLRPMSPFWIEERLTQKLGFVLESNEYQKPMIFVKKINLNTNIKTDPLNISGLSNNERSELEDRCDSLVDMYPDPYNAIPAVRQRLINLSEVLIGPKKEFVIKYMEENFPANDEKKVG